MNFVDLVKLQVKDINNDRIFYGRSKTGDQLSVRITNELKDILSYYIEGKSVEDYLFPANYDGSTKHFEKYKTQRRRMNENLKIIAKDAGIEEHFTTYTIRHSWATIAKFMGVPTEVISEGLGHNSLKTTEIYLKSFTNHVLDEANEMVVS
jgi:integrase